MHTSFLENGLLQCTYMRMYQFLCIGLESSSNKVIFVSSMCFRPAQNLRGGGISPPFLYIIRDDHILGQKCCVVTFIPIHCT